jgi:tetratricopeptide (TPR) repeat protein
MTSEKLSQAVQLIKSGNKQAALPLLKEVVQADPNNENAWLWLYSCVEIIEQKKYCLQQAIRINPSNENACATLLKLENPIPSLVQSIQPRAIPSSPKSSAQLTIAKKSPIKKSGVGGKDLIIGVLFAIILFGVCGLYIAFSKVSISPDKRYANSVYPAMQPLVAWQSEYENFGTLLYEPTGDGGLSRAFLLTLFMQLTVTRESYTQMGFTELDDLVAPSIKLATDGYKILDVINVVTPVFEIEAAHNQVVKCIQVRISNMETISSAVSNLSPSLLLQLNDMGDCDTFDAAVAKLVNFVESNK